MQSALPQFVENGGIHCVLRHAFAGYPSIRTFIPNAYVLECLYAQVYGPDDT